MGSANTWRFENEVVVYDVFSYFKASSFIRQLIDMLQPKYNTECFEFSCTNSEIKICISLYNGCFLVGVLSFLFHWFTEQLIPKATYLRLPLWVNRIIIGCSPLERVLEVYKSGSTFIIGLHIVYIFEIKTRS